MHDTNPDIQAEPIVLRGFWRTQFSREATAWQLAFDVLAGIVLPLVCFVFDPIVFKSNSGWNLPPSGLSSIRLFVYCFSGVCMLALAIWLSAGKRLNAWGNVVAGTLLSGGIGSALIGVLILPMSVSNSRLSGK